MAKKHDDVAPMTSSLGAAIFAASRGVANMSQWKKLIKARYAIKFDDGRVVLRLPAYDYLSKWNKAHRESGGYP